MKLKFFELINKIKNYLNIKFILLTILVGIISGLSAVLFYVMLEFSKFFFINFIAGDKIDYAYGNIHFLPEYIHKFHRWLLIFLPALGTGAGGVLTYFFAPEAEGHGIDNILDTYHNKDSKMKIRVPIVRFFASILTIGSGGSAGRVGPIAQIGAGLASFFTNLFKISKKERKIFMVAGMASAIGALIHAPIGGALFAAEVLYRDLDIEYDIIIPTAIASIISYTLYSSILGYKVLLLVPQVKFDNALHLIPYFFLAVFIAMSAILFVITFKNTKKFFFKLPIPKIIKPFIGGLITGIILFFMPEVMGTGLGILQNIILNNTNLTLLLLIAIFKIIATSFTIGSGGSGGIFAPTMMIGGCLGGFVGNIFIKYMPFFQINPTSFIIVGMAGFFSASANTPISVIILISEITGCNTLIVPIMFTSIIAYLMAIKYHIYDNQIISRINDNINK
ncbi:MAG: chloride channel protein [Spirochaetes bacterium]|nr:chloride channel protein [Spirochaetota bacterium]